MAKRDKTGADGADTDAGVADDGEVEGKKKGKFLFILLPLILLGLGGGGFLAYSQYVTLAVMGYEDESGVEEESEPLEYGEFKELDNLIINPTGTDGKRYLMVKIGFESDKPAALEELTTKDVVVRDAIVRYLSAQTVPDLAAIEKRDSLKGSLRKRINNILEEGQITRLYFTQYVIQ